jgi:hypothetical protein
VTDAFSNPVSGVAVTFASPGSGPGATFSGPTSVIVNNERFRYRGIAGAVG